MTKKGQYLPLCYYKNKLGFSDELLAAIEKNCDKQFDPNLQVIVFSYIYLSD